MKGVQTGRASLAFPHQTSSKRTHHRHGTKQNFAPNKIFTKGARPPPTALSIRGPARVTTHDQCKVRMASIPRKLGRGGGPGRPHAAFFHSSENVTYDDASPATGVCQERGLQPDLVASSWVRAPPAATEEGPPRRPAGWQAWPGRLAPWPAIPMTSHLKVGLPAKALAWGRTGTGTGHPPAHVRG